MGGRNDEIVGVDRREIEFARMRSDMARAESRHFIVLSKTSTFDLRIPRYASILIFRTQLL